MLCIAVQHVRDVSPDHQTIHPWVMTHVGIPVIGLVGHDAHVIWRSLDPTMSISGLLLLYMWCTSAALHPVYAGYTSTVHATVLSVCAGLCKSSLSLSG